ncbi:MAG: metallophosphoesterase [Bacilli bacterium]|nr:metallophosphoesterase [Bacilli bacterium]
MKNKKLFIFSPLLALSLTSCGKTYESKDYILELPWKDDFRILQLNDIHIGNKDDQELQFQYLDLVINDANANADLIVLNGDLFTFADRSTARRLFTFMDKHNTPWTVTFGNHDEQAYFSIDWLTGYLNDLNDKRASGESYCVFKDLQDDDIMGNCNFAINLMKDGKVKEQVILMDSNRYNFGKYEDYDSYTGYDCIHDEQVKWYEDMVNYTKANNGGVTVPSVAFFHIPFPEFETAWEESKKDPSMIVIPQTDKSEYEGVAAPKINTKLFDKMVELRSTNGVFCAHDHKNNYAIEYKGIILSYGVNSTDRVYWDEDLCGGQVNIIHNDGSLDFKQIFHSYDELNKEGK